MEAAVTIAALPVAALALWALLRAPDVASRLVAHPTGERWHERATPTFGGVGIAAGLAAGIGLALAAGAVEPTWLLAGILTGCALLFLAGLVDDLRHLSPIAKLAAQFAAAGIAIAAGLRVELIGNDVIGVVIAFVWLVGITNAFNLLDNMDGLAATLATVACIYFAVDAATVHENDLVLVLSLALAFACLGFLPFNLRPGDSARVFMGDAGSQLLGFLLASLGLASSWTTAGTTVATMLLPLLVLAIPILDTTLVTVRRLAERRPVTQGGRDHTSHRLVYYGLSETRAVGLLALIAVALGATSVAYNVLDRPAITALGVLVTFALLVQFGSFLSELSEQERRGRPGDTRLRHALVVQPRRLVELVADAGIVGTAFLGSYLMFVDGRGSELQRGTFLAVLPVVLGTTYVVYVLAGVYRRAWRYATARDLVTIAAASALATLVALGIVVATRDLGFSLGVFAVYGVVAAFLAAASRWFVRFVPEESGADDGRRRVLVVGAGRAGRAVARDLREGSEAHVVGYLDDNPRLRRRRLQGVPVLGPTGDVTGVLASSRADELVVTIPDAPPDRLELLTEACVAAHIPWRVVRERAVGTRTTTTQAIAE